MRIARILLPVVLTAATAACAGTQPKQLAAGALPVEGPVSVRWEDPMQFSEVRSSIDRWEATRSDWITPLAKHLRERSARELRPGERLRLTIVDVDLAGDFEPWLGPDFQRVRMLREVYPPRMTVRYELVGADGQTISSGERRLSDMSFLSNSTPLNSSDTLRYEKRMIDGWVYQEFGRRSASN